MEKIREKTVQQLKTVKAEDVQRFQVTNGRDDVIGSRQNKDRFASGDEGAERVSQAGHAGQNRKMGALPGLVPVQSRKILPENKVSKNSYGEKEFSQEMKLWQSKAFSVGEPFIYVQVKSKESFCVAVSEKASPYYRQVSLRGDVAGKREGEIFCVARSGSAAQRLGTIEQMESDENPMSHHLLMVNDDIFCFDSYDREEHEESLAAASVLFDIGKGVEKNPATAILLRRRIPQERKEIVFGRVFVEALAEKDMEVAKACLAQGASVASYDRDGRDALSEMLEPGMEEILDLSCRKTATLTTYHSLLIAKEELSDSGDVEQIRAILQAHIDRLKVGVGL